MPVSRPWTVVSPLLVVALVGSASARGEDLMQIYREAQQNDPTLAAAQSTWVATQEKVPQARAGLLPNVSVTGAANYNAYDLHVNGGELAGSFSRDFRFGQLTVSASQPLFRYANRIQYDQAKQQVEQSDFSLVAAQQDLILRVANAYFAILLAEFSVDLVVSQKAAVAENLAQAKRNFEVGVATITDTNDAQAKYDAIIAQEIQARNDLDNKRVALRAIIGRMPRELKKLGPGFEPILPSPNNLDFWIDKSQIENVNVRIAQYNYEIAALNVETQKAGHYPTLDLVGSYNTQASNQSINYGVPSNSQLGVVGVQLTIPIYTGGFVSSKVREAIALQDQARSNLEATKRTALFNAQTGFTGVNSAAASVKANEQAVKSAQVAYDSTKTGLEVGVRTNLDVLNTQQNVYQARQTLAQSYFNYLIGILQLKAAVGTLTDEDLEDINRRLRG